MAETNNERVGRALGLVAAGIGPFVRVAMAGRLEADLASAPDASAISPANAALLLGALDANWDVVSAALGEGPHRLVAELSEAATAWQGRRSFTSDEAYRVLDNAELLLRAVSAGTEAAEVAQAKQDLLRRRFGEEARRVSRRAAAQPLEGMPTGNLLPWRFVATPHLDVQRGTYQQAEFAADLHQVWRGEAEPEYGDPVEFFRRTFLTEGLRDLLVNAACRLRGEGGDPVVQLQTNFGGGKTHSLIALYHLASGTDPSNLVGVEDMLAAKGLESVPSARRAVLVGQMLTPSEGRSKPDGTVVRTMWGELAWQLGGAEGYQLVAAADEAGTNPGERLIELLETYSPCLILIDEWVAYARLLYGRDDLPAGSFDTQMTFAQALSDAAKTVKNSMLVVSIPASDIEVGGEAGKQALDRLSNVIFRQEASWRPASAEEGFEIVRRRLFEEPTPEMARERDAVVNAFADLYQAHPADFPAVAREGEYRRRIAAAYPIHPELFDQLYEGWSALEKFQRTRGVLRLMAAVIHALWARDDGGLLIMPSSVPIDSDEVHRELLRYLEDAWAPVIASDVDGPTALPLQLDLENANFKRVSATRRVARAIYMGSAPTLHQVNKGIDDTRVKLGTAQPGESPAVFGDALRRLSTRAMYLVEDHGNYWFALGQTVSRTAADRAQARFMVEQADEEIVRRLRTRVSPAEFAGVHISPAGPTDVPDQDDCRLVVLGPEFPHASGTDVSPARSMAERILAERAGGSRLHRNMLVFAAPDAQRLSELRDATRSWLAWQSVLDDRETLNLDAQQARHAATQATHFNETVQQQLDETFVWLLAPFQDSPQTATIAWDVARVTGAGSVAERAAKRLRNEEGYVTEYAATRLRLDLDRVPLWRGDDVGLKQLWTDFTQYLYLPRMKNRDVLLRAVEQGLEQINWRQDTFAYAEGVDSAAGRYLGLTAGGAALVRLDDASLLVRPDVAAAQMAALGSGPGELTPVPPGGAPARPEQEPSQPGPEPTVPPAAAPKRFYATTSLNPQRVSRDADTIAREVISHLVSLVGADVEVRLEISAGAPEGISDDVVRIVSENVRALGFDQHGFEAD